jgi:hypothetical protein
VSIYAFMIETAFRPTARTISLLPPSAVQYNLHPLSRSSLAVCNLEQAND